MAKTATNPKKRIQPKVQSQKKAAAPPPPPEAPVGPAAATPPPPESSQEVLDQVSTAANEVLARTVPLVWDGLDGDTRIEIDLTEGPSGWRPLLKVFAGDNPEPVVQVALASMTQSIDAFCVAHLRANQRLGQSAWLSRLKQIRKQLGFLNPSANLPTDGGPATQQFMATRGNVEAEDRAQVIEEIESLQEDLGATYYEVFFPEHPGAENLSVADRNLYLQAQPMVNLTALLRQGKELINVKKRHADTSDLPAGAVRDGDGVPEAVKQARRSAERDGVGVSR